HVRDLRDEHVTLFVNGSAFRLPAGLLGERTDVAMQARLAANGSHDVVVVVHQARGEHLALVRVRVAAEPHGMAAAEGTHAQFEIGFTSAAFRRCDLDARSRIRDEHARLRFLEFEAAGNRTDRAAARAADEPAERPTDTARIILGADDGRCAHEARAPHPAAPQLRAGTQLARLGERALLHHVLHRHPAFDDDEAVRLLHHHANEAGRRLQSIARESLRDVALRLDDRERAHRPVAMFEPAVPLRSAWTRGPLNLAAPGTLLHRQWAALCERGRANQ